jgi:hypothetical protein
MRTPEFTAEHSLFKSGGSYGGDVAAGRPGAVMPQQGIVARPPIEIPPVSINCDARLRSCQWWCRLVYGLSEQALVCGDACGVEWQRCRGLLRDPNYDPFADHFAGVP